MYFFFFTNITNYASKVYHSNPFIRYEMLQQLSRSQGQWDTSWDPDTGLWLCPPGVRKSRQETVQSAEI